ncbi:tyrosine-type recombinase/integrase [Nocardia sp. R7R-8]|uniref:tyrosine-type recombinase/integrase n=1 Tax=Nocardia sp. R7R-8 TaxID=3459304 RepID=UPI00403D7469
MAGRLVIGDIRVQEVAHRDGRRGYTVLVPSGAVYRLADGFLRARNGGTDRTYAYLLVDHLRWLVAEGLSPETVTLRDLQRYMVAVGAEFPGPFGRPWREGKPPYSESSLKSAAACLKGFYLYQATLGTRQDLAEEFERTRLPTRADRRRSFLGHVKKVMPANPLTPTAVVRRRHPKMPPTGARERIVADRPSARDRLTVTWLADGGFRVGELCGLHLVDLHLRENAACGECGPPHVHICHRDTNPNRARVKTKRAWSIQDNTVCGGTIRRVSSAMIHTYFDYITTEYPRGAEHGMLLVQLHGRNAGQPWRTAGVRGVLSRAAARLELGRVRPHQFRHEFATNVLDASGGNIVLARDAGGWASAVTVEQTYGHVDVHDPVFSAALRTVWGEDA